MSKYYNPKRKSNLYKPDMKKPFKLSRSKIDLFMECPKCFYLDRVLGVGRPPGYPFALNAAVDRLLKQEFDIHRVKGTQHPLQKEYGIKARPVEDDKLDKYRHNFTGVQYHDQETNLVIFGAIDDLWINPQKEYIVVDYKATAKKDEITELNKDWHDSYKRQMEVYQWLLRKNGYKVSNTGYFVYCNGIADKKAFDKKLEFRVNLIPYQGSDKWVDKTIKNIYQCLNSDNIPAADPDCDYCAYFKARGREEK
ncbi:MAG: PD-(D/E)XK nuclease family protein [Patescibacteria group bacterium]|nr:PD-(D/E)XK nuclease family protein [Patescibacteria group bacterium]